MGNVYVPQLYLDTLMEKWHIGIGYVFRLPQDAFSAFIAQ